MALKYFLGCSKAFLKYDLNLCGQSHLKAKGHFYVIEGWGVIISVESSLVAPFFKTKISHSHFSNSNECVVVIFEMLMGLTLQFKVCLLQGNIKVISLKMY